VFLPTYFFQLRQPSTNITPFSLNISLCCNALDVFILYIILLYMYNHAIWISTLKYTCLDQFQTRVSKKFKYLVTALIVALHLYMSQLNEASTLFERYPNLYGTIPDCSCRYVTSIKISQNFFFSTTRHFQWISISSQSQA